MFSSRRNTAGQREEERAGEQQLDQLVDAADRMLNAARSTTSATVSSIIAARNTAAIKPQSREKRSRQRFTIAPDIASRPVESDHAPPAHRGSL